PRARAAGPPTEALPWNSVYSARQPRVTEPVGALASGPSDFLVRTCGAEGRAAPASVLAVPVVAAPGWPRTAAGAMIFWMSPRRGGCAADPGSDHDCWRGGFVLAKCGFLPLFRPPSCFPGVGRERYLSPIDYERPTSHAGDRSR